MTRFMKGALILGFLPFLALAWLLVFALFYTLDKVGTLLGEDER